MKKFLIGLALLAFCLTASAGLTTDQDFYKLNKRTLHSGGTNDPLYQLIGELDGMTDGTGTSTYTNLLFSNSVTSDPTSTEGRLYYNTTSNLLKFYNGSSWVDIEANTGGLSLDGSYGLGSAITVDNGVMVYTATNAADNVVLTLAQADTGTTKALTLTNAGSGNTIDIQGTSGNDIEGTGNTWSVTTAGALTAVGVATSAELTVTAADVLFDDTYDIAWDTSRDTLIAQDNAKIGFGGAHDAAADTFLTFDGSNLTLGTITSDEGFLVGTAADGFDVTYAFEDAGQIRTDYDADFLNFTDDMDLRFGTGASSDGDFILSSDSSNVLTLEQVVGGTGTMVIGASGVDIPIIWNGETCCC